MANTQNSFRPWVWIYGLGLVGLLDSIWLLITHLSQGSMSQACSVSSVINCDVLRLPQYSEWFGTPVPVFSILFYLLVLAIARAGSKTTGSNSSRPLVYLWLLSWVALASTLYMAWVSFSLKNLCPYCSILYVVSVLFFFVM